MTINTQKLRDLIRRAVPLPWQLATSNSWRRILSRDGAAVCSPLNQSDEHPDLHFPGGAEGPTAKLLIEAANALPTLLDHIDAQAAEIAEAKGQIEYLDRQNNALRQSLGSMIHAYVRLLDCGRDRILDLGGQCDPLDVMEASDPWLRDARAALSGESRC